MAQELFYKPVGSIQLKANDSYTSANIPAVCDTVVLAMGVRLTDHTGLTTPLRGIRIVIEHNETPATSPKPNVPYIWIEGDELVFDTDYTYTPLESGIVAYGIKVLV